MYLIALEIILKAFSFLFFSYYLRILIIFIIDIFSIFFIKDKFLRYFSIFLSLFFFKNFEIFNEVLLKDKIYKIEGYYEEDNKIRVCKIENKNVSKKILIIFKSRPNLDNSYIRGNFKIKKEFFNKASACYFVEIISINSLSYNYLKKKLREIIFDITYNYDKITYRFFNSIVLGERAKLGKNRLDIFKKTGLMHILALSGLHFHLLSYIFNLILYSIRINKKFEKLILFFLLTLYFLAAQFSPSLLRAYLMESFRILSKILGEKDENLKSFCLALIISLLINKSFLLDLSFQMSYIATLAILLVNKRTKNILYINLIIFIFIAPLQLIYFKSLNLSSIFYNLLFVPIFGLIIKLIFLSIIVYPISLKLNCFIVLITSKLINLLLSFLDLISNKFIFILNFNIVYLITCLTYIIVFILNKERSIYERFKKFYLFYIK